MKTETLKAILNAFNAAGDDATRYTLMYVRLEATKGSVKVSASDGHMLSEVTLTDSDLENVTGVYAVSPDSLPALKGILKDSKNVGGVQSDVQTDSILLKGLSGYSVEIKTCKAAGIEFPDFEQVKPKITEPVFEVSFDASLLLSLAKAMQENSKRNPVVKMRFSGSVKPIEVKIDGQVGVLMPCRL